jgi:ABC-type polysaccharide/polyol phosphate transport system ATPase subunit
MEEILAAGDASFQGKARARMLHLIDQARIMVFVSHDMTAIKSVCNRVIYLQDGRVVADGSAETVIKTYLDSVK